MKPILRPMLWPMADDGGIDVDVDADADADVAEDNGGGDGNGDGDANADAAAGTDDAGADAAADAEVLVSPLTVASSRAGHLKQSLEAVRRREQGVGWCDLRKREENGSKSGEARKAGHLQRLLLPMLTRVLELLPLLLPGPILTLR